MFNPSPIYSAHKSSNHKPSIKHKTSPYTNLHKQDIHKHQTQNFQRISPFDITPVEKALRLGPFRQFINTRFLKSIKEWTEAVKFFFKYYINA